MGQAQINVRTQACSGTFIARTKQAALTHNVRGKRLKVTDESRPEKYLLIIIIHTIILNQNKIDTIVKK